jgi:hypothetical protein
MIKNSLAFWCWAIATRAAAHTAARHGIYVLREAA